MILLPNLDYFASLFIPMSAKSIVVCSRPVGYRWIAALTLAMGGGLLATQDWPKSASLVVMYAGAFFFVASYTTVTQRAEAFREGAKDQLITPMWVWLDRGIKREISSSTGSQTATARGRRARP